MDIYFKSSLGLCRCFMHLFFIFATCLLPFQVNADVTFESAENCKSCHPRQFDEWSTSMMAYGAVSPTFNTLEHIGNVMNNGAFAKGGAAELFCQNCHTPIAGEQDEIPTWSENLASNPSGRKPTVHFMSGKAKEAVTCDVCHQIEGPHSDGISGSIDDSLFQNGGIGNASFEFLDNSGVKLGPFLSSELVSEPNAHARAKSDYLGSSAFCGSCHDVRINGTDTETGESFRRLENLFTEWESSVWQSGAAPNPVGEQVTCQGCHMSTFPQGQPNEYAQGPISIQSTSSKRITNHYFTGVDLALINFPGHQTQKARRQALLERAAEIDVSIEPNFTNPLILPVDVTVTNVGAGHNIPSGFSQERQFWVKLEVYDANNTLIYRSGYLDDRDGDGRINDEDLNNFNNAPNDEGFMELATDLEVIGVENHELYPDFFGPDFNQRSTPEGKIGDLGLVNFGNEFIRNGLNGEGYHEEVFSPFLADAMENTHSLKPFDPKTFRYNVKLADNLGDSIQYPFQVKASLHFRAFPPRFLKALVKASQEHNLGLLTPDVVDKNEIVDMDETAKSVVERRFRIENYWRAPNAINVQDSVIAEANGIALGAWSAQWIIEPTGFQNYVRIRNRWRSNLFLHAQHDDIEVGTDPNILNWHSAQWEIEKVAGTQNRFRIRNRWKSDSYLHFQNLELGFGPVEPGWLSAQWTFRPIN